jgi:chaperonin GroES
MCAAYEKMSAIICLITDNHPDKLTTMPIMRFGIKLVEMLCPLNEASTLNKQKINIIMAKKLNITPLHDRVIVKPAAAEEKSAGGIIIPDTAKEKPQRGIVVAAGPGKKDEPVTVKSGDAVLYGKYSGTEITFEGVEYLIMRESDILAIV